MTLKDIQNYININLAEPMMVYTLLEYLNKSINNNCLTSEEKDYIRIETTILQAISSSYGYALKDTYKTYPELYKNCNYIEKRIKESSSFILKAIYAEILYCSNMEKYKSYINCIVNNYFKSFEIVKEKLLIKSTNVENNYIHGFLNVIHRLLHYSVISKFPKLKEIKKGILDLTEIPNDFELYSYFKISIIKEMLKNSKIFKKDDFEKIDDIFYNIVNKKLKDKDYSYLINILDFGHKIDIKRQKLSYPWDDILGKCYEKLAEVANSNLASSMWYISAIKHYNKCNRYNAKVKELEIKYIKCKDKIEMHTTPVNIGDDSFLDFAKNVLKDKPDKIFKILSFSDEILPSLESLKNDNVSISTFIPITYLDNNSYPSKVSNINSEQDKYLYNYHFYWSIYQTQIQYILLEGIKSNKINLQTLINYLMYNSCFFDLLQKKMTTKRSIEYNWSSTIISIFEIYFNEVLKWQKEPKIYYPYLVTITESLVLKFETWIRQFLYCYKQPTIASLPHKEGIIQEKDLNYLLYDDFIKDKFNINDLLYFRYLFIAKEGQNLRNNIAHGLLIPEQYTFELFNLVFLAFLRLSKYNFTIRK